LPKPQRRVARCPRRRPYPKFDGYLLLLGGRARSLLAGPVMPRDGSGVGH